MIPYTLVEYYVMKDDIDSFKFEGDKIIVEHGKYVDVWIKCSGGWELISCEVNS